LYSASRSPGKTGIATNPQSLARTRTSGSANTGYPAVLLYGNGLLQRAETAARQTRGVGEKDNLRFIEIQAFLTRNNESRTGECVRSVIAKYFVDDPAGLTRHSSTYKHRNIATFAPLCVSYYKVWANQLEDRWARSWW
jgi:hypothetical protein